MSATMETDQRELNDGGQVAAILDQIEVATPKAIEALNRSEIDMQITTAKRYPRVLSAVLREVETMATVDRETADKCFYRLKRENRREGKTTWIVGPSVRFAEMVLCAWGNIRHSIQIIDTEGDFAVARATVHDLERNGFHAAESVRQIVTTDKRSGQKKRYSNDMIQTTAMAAASIALRNATFRVIPIGLFHSLLAKVDDVALGKGETMDKRRTTLVDYFKSIGVSLSRVLSAVDRATLEDVTVNDLANLRGLARAIKDGETTVDEAFPLETINADAPKTNSEKVRAAIDNVTKVGNRSNDATSETKADESERDRLEREAWQAIKGDAAK